MFDPLVQIVDSFTRLPRSIPIREGVWILRHVHFPQTNCWRKIVLWKTTFLFWKPIFRNYITYINGFPIATGDFANCIWGLSLKPCGSMLFMFLPSFLPWRGGMMSRRMRTLEFFEFRFMTLNLMYTYTLWQDEHISLTVEQMSYIHCGRKFRDNSGYSA